VTAADAVDQTADHSQPLEVIVDRAQPELILLRRDGAEVFTVDRDELPQLVDDLTAIRDEDQPQ